MGSVTTMNRRGQVTIPRELRDQLGLKTGDRVTFTLMGDGTVVLRAKNKPLADLRGVLSRPGQPAVPIDDMNPFK